MRSVTLALRGLWWRRGASAVLALVAVVCVAVAAAGPAYAAAAGDAVVQTTLRAAPVDASGTGLSVSLRVSDSRPALDRLRNDVRPSFAALVDTGEYDPAVYSLQGNAHVLDVAGQVAITSPVVSRDGVCAHVVIVAGSCLSDDVNGIDGALVSESTAAALGWTVGTTLPFVEYGQVPGTDPLTVRGVYRPTDPDGAYWFAATHDYFDATAATEAVLVTETSWSRSTAEATLYADLALVPGAIHRADLSGLADRVQLAAALLRARPGRTGYSDVVTTGLPSVVYGAEQAADSVAAPVTSVIAQLLVLAFAVLFLLMVGSHESRGGEVAMGKVRGMSPPGAVLHATLEPTLLVAAAVPAGVGVAAVLLHLVAPVALGHGVAVSIGAGSWLAAAVAGGAGVVAAVLAGGVVLRRPVLSQWQRTERRPGRIGWIAEAVAVALALGATSQLLSSARSGGRFAFLPSAAPALFAVAFALVGARVLPLLARAGFAATRASRAVGGFVAVRQLARRRGGLRAFGMVCVAVALVVFGLCSHVVFQFNRQARAVAEVGADRVVDLQSTPVGTDVEALVDRVDPGGTWATAVYQGSYQRGPDDALATGGSDFDISASSTTPSLLVVDPDRFARVASSAPGAGGPSLSAAVATIAGATPAVVAVQGTTLQVAGSVTSSVDGAVKLRAGLTDSVGRAVDVDLGQVTGVAGPVGAAGVAVPFDLSASVAACDGACRLRWLSLGVPTARGPLRANVAFTAVADVAADGTSTSLLAGLTAAHWTSFDDSDLSVRIDQDPSTLTLRLSTADASEAGENGFGAYVGLPDTVPGLVTSSQQSAIPGGSVDLDAASGTFTVRPTGVALLPRAGDAGVLVTQQWLAASQPDGYQAFSPNQVWLSAAAPADFPARLAAAGLTASRVESVADRAAVLARQGPSLAVAALGFGGLTAAVLAVAGAAATFVVDSRRRLYELAALRALGMRPRRIWWTVLAEQAVTAMVAAVFGAAAGLLGARAALQVLPEFGDRPSFPPLVVALPVVGSTLAAAAVAVAVALVTGVLAAGLVRRADTSRLRDSQG